MLKERSAAEEHCIDLCRLLGEPTPAEADPAGDHYCFERGAIKDSGGDGWADVWKRHCFAWEYKGRRANLDAAFDQLRQYALALENPPLLIVSDMRRFRIRTNWTNSVSRTLEFELDDLMDAAVRDKLKWAMSDPERLRPGETRQTLTERAARTFARLAQSLRDQGHEPQEVAHFVNRLVFCMFAEDVGLLPDDMFTRLLRHARVSVWIDEIQWMRRNGFAGLHQAILDPVETIECRDAILTPEGGEPEWPDADAIVGNPPFLGGKLLIENLGENYVSTLFDFYQDRVLREADLVCYWFVKAGESAGGGAAKRIGLLATNPIRGAANRRALQKATEKRPIFDAWSDEPWVIDSAAARVSLVCFSRADDESPMECRLDGEVVDAVNTDLTAGIDLTKARRLASNRGVALDGSALPCRRPRPTRRRTASSMCSQRSRCLRLRRFGHRDGVGDGRRIPPAQLVLRGQSF